MPIMTPVNSNPRLPPKSIPKVILRPKSKFAISWHWVLTVFLLFYSIFSFVWLSVLYTGHNGIKFCADSSTFCDISFPLTKQAIVYFNENSKSTTELTKQKAGKNFIRGLWYEQSSLQDDQSSQEQELEQVVLDYKNYLQNYIRFLNGESQLLNGFDQTEYTQKLTVLEEKIQTLRLKRNQNVETKATAKKQIDQLYSDLKERQENSYKLK